MGRNQDTKTEIKEKNYPNMSNTLNKLNNIIRNVEDRSHQEFYESTYGKKGSYKKINCLYNMCCYTIMVISLIVCYVLSRRSYIYLNRNCKLNFLVSFYIVLICGIGIYLILIFLIISWLQKHKFKELVSHFEKFNSTSELNLRCKLAIQEMRNGFKSKLGMNDYKVLFDEIAARLSEKDNNLTRIYSAIGNMVMISLLSPTIAILIEEDIKFDDLFLILLVICIGIISIYLLIEKLLKDLKNGNPILDREKSSLLKCKKYIETILFYHLVETDNSDTEREQEALLDTNKEIIKALKAIQTEIAELNYPKKLKKALTEKD